MAIDDLRKLYENSPNLLSPLQNNQKIPSPLRPVDNFSTYQTSCNTCASKDAEIAFLRTLLKQTLESKDIIIQELMAPYKPSAQIFQPKEVEGSKLKIEGVDPDGNEIHQEIDFTQEILGH